MNFVNADSITNLFETLNQNQINYILLRNINIELPNKLEKGKDIDIIVHKSSEEKFKLTLTEGGYKTVSHPYCKDTYLYNCKPFTFYKNLEEVLVDYSTELICRSLQGNCWLPVDQRLQEAAWENKVFTESSDLNYWSLSPLDELVHLITRCIFDKKKFPEDYCKRITELFHEADLGLLYANLSLVFFKYTNTLIEKVSQKQFQDLYSNYFSFKDY